MKYVFLIACILAMAACSNQQSPENAPAQVLATHNTAFFNQQFGLLMRQYLGLKDAFIAEKDSLINNAELGLEKQLDSVPYAEIKRDSVRTNAKTAAEEVRLVLKTLQTEKTIVNKRLYLGKLSDALFGLVKVVQFNAEKLYQQNCPMAFGDSGANWISNSPDIKNPFLPKKMLTCGGLTDSNRTTNK